MARVKHLPIRRDLLGSKDGQHFAKRRIERRVYVRLLFFVANDGDRGPHDAAAEPTKAPCEQGCMNGEGESVATCASTSGMLDCPLIEALETGDESSGFRYPRRSSRKLPKLSLPSPTPGRRRADDKPNLGTRFTHFTTIWSEVMMICFDSCSCSGDDCPCPPGSRMLLISEAAQPRGGLERHAHGPL